MAGNYPEKDALKGDKRLKEASQNGKARDQAQVATRPRPKADYYEKVVDHSTLLNIPFKNQSSVTLANEAFQIYTRGEKIYSTFNSEVRSVFFDYMKGPFVFSNYLRSS